MNRPIRNAVEERVLGEIDRHRAPKRLRQACPAKTALEAAYAVYAAKHGEIEGRCWAAHKAHHAPPALATDRSRAAAEAVFSNLGEGAQ